MRIPHTNSDKGFVTQTLNKDTVVVKFIRNDNYHLTYKLFKNIYHTNNNTAIIYPECTKSIKELKRKIKHFKFRKPTK